MSYMDALEAAGAKVVRYEYFGDYQGTILVEVEYEDLRGYVEISYGSCSHCDAYEAFTSDLNWDHEPTQQELSNFGRNYLEDIESAEKLIEQFTKRIEWDYEAEDMIKWLKEA